jgi:hypothetical protein
MPHGAWRARTGASLRSTRFFEGIGLNLETAVERARAGRDAVGWQGANRSHALRHGEDSQRRKRRSAARSGA